MGKTFKRPPIKQHKRLLEDGEFSSRVEKNKKKENKNKHPKRELDYDWYTEELKALYHNE